MNDDNHAASVEIKALTKRYRQQSKPAVDSVDLHIRAGEFMTFLGPSGSGKTTTLNMIAGFEKPSSGEIIVSGRDIAQTPAHERNMGVVFQNYALFPHLSVFENIAFPLRRRGLRHDVLRSKVENSLDRVQMGAFADRKPKELSGGQQQRVAVARAIVFEPKVLLMDEPFGALDKALRESLQVELKRLHREIGMTVLFVTHDQSEALLLSDRITVFNNGQIEQTGTGRDLYNNPASLFVANFIGDSTIVDGDIVGANHVQCALGNAIAVTTAKPQTSGRCSLVFRPEIFRVERIGEDVACPQPGCLNGVVSDAFYLGQEMRMRVRVGNPQVEIKVTVRDEQIREEFAIGTKVTLRYHPDDVIILADAAS